MKEKFKNIVGTDDYVRPQKMNNQKGITLIALIISIIVMLILAAVSINIVINQGIITKSQTAQENHQSSAEEEAINIGYSEYLIKKYNRKNVDLEIVGAVSEPITDGWKITFNNGKSYILLTNGTITPIEDNNSGEDTNTPGDETEKWWMPTEQEKIDIGLEEDWGEDNWGEIAEFRGASNPGDKAVVIENETIVICFVHEGRWEYYFYYAGTEDKFTLEDFGIEVEKEKWHYTEFKENNAIIKDEEYHGECPITKDDFIDIYSETYLEKIIDSFNK